MGGSKKERGGVECHGALARGGVMVKRGSIDMGRSKDH